MNSSTAVQINKSIIRTLISHWGALSGGFTTVAFHAAILPTFLVLSLAATAAPSQNEAHLQDSRTPGNGIAESEIRQDQTNTGPLEDLAEKINDAVKPADGMVTNDSVSSGEHFSSFFGSGFLTIVLGVLLSGIAWWRTGLNIRRCLDAKAEAEAERDNLLTTLTSIGDAVLVTDAAGRVKLANPIAEKLIGRSESLVGMSFRNIWTVVSSAQRHSVPNAVDTMVRLQSNGQQVGRTLLVRSDGSEIPIEESTASIRDKSGAISGQIVVFRDCSKQLEFERRLQAREQHLRQMLQTPLIGIAVCTSDGRRLLEANEAYLQLIGHSRWELSGNSLSWDGTEAPRGLFDENSERELRTTGICRPFEKVCQRCDGSEVPVLISANKLTRDDDRIIVFVNDLSDSKKSQASLRESERRFSTLSESMPQIVWLATVQGDVNYVNQTFVKYSGRPESELLGRGWTDLLHADDHEAYLNAWKTALATSQPLEIEHRLLHNAGEYHWHLTRALPMYGEGGEISQWVGTTTDIDDHKRVEALLKEEHARKDQFLAIIAHELRNPLAPLANVVEILAAAPHDPALINELKPIMRRKVRQMSRLIDDLLDVARITQGRMTLKRERAPVGFIVDAAVEASQLWIDEFDHELTVKLPPETLWIDADSARLTQVLGNLLHNAAQYTSPRGKISLTVEHSGQEVIFRVRDNGQGIAPSMLTQIFDLFIHVEPPFQRVPGGLGIGLSLVKTLVELHEGTVFAESEGIGQGSEFIVRLPLMEAVPDPRATPVEAAPVQPASMPALQVLVVDDVRASAKTLAMMLKVLGQNVQMAFDGPSAIAEVLDRKFDVVFLDIAMPGMDGLEVARQLRAMPAYKDLMLVALTGFGQDDDRQRSLEAGFNEHLIKPTSLDLLQDVLQRAAQRAVRSA